MRSRRVAVPDRRRAVDDAGDVALRRRHRGARVFAERQPGGDGGGERASRAVDAPLADRTIRVQLLEARFVRSDEENENAFRLRFESTLVDKRGKAIATFKSQDEVDDGKDLAELTGTTSHFTPQFGGRSRGADFLRDLCQVKICGPERRASDNCRSEQVSVDPANTAAV